MIKCCVNTARNDLLSSVQVESDGGRRDSQVNNSKVYAIYNRLLHLHELSITSCRTDPTYEAIAATSSQEHTSATENDQPDSSSRSEDVIKVSMLRKAVNINWGILCQSRPRIVMKVSICVYNRILPSTI